jgi:hypothetical protein
MALVQFGERSHNLVNVVCLDLSYVLEDWLSGVTQKQEVLEHAAIVAPSPSSWQFY